MFENGSMWRPPNCTSYLEETEKTKEEVKEEVKEEKKPQTEKKSSKPSRKGLLNDRFALCFVQEDFDLGSLASSFVPLIHIKLI